MRKIKLYYQKTKISQVRRFKPVKDVPLSPSARRTASQPPVVPEPAQTSQFVQQCSFASIRPFVRFVKEVFLSADAPQRPVCAYDHRLLYITGGQAQITWAGFTQRVLPGHLLYWPSGTPYLISPEPEVQGICVNFDFLHTHTAASPAIPLTLAEDYDPGRCMERIRFEDAPVFSSPLMLTEAPGVLPYLQAMTREADPPERFTLLQLSCLMGAALVEVQRCASQPARVGSAYRAILEYVHAHYGQELSNQVLGQMFGYHPNYISQLIQEHTGMPLHRYLLNLRITHAVQLLESTDIPIAEIAARVGFKNPSYFSQYFKKQTGYPPRAFRLE